MPKGERNSFPLAIVSPVPRTCLSPRQESKCAQLATSENLKVTIAIFDYSLLVIDQGGYVLIGKALD